MKKKYDPSNITISKESSIFQKIDQNIAFWDTVAGGDNRPKLYIEGMTPPNPKWGHNTRLFL